MKVLLLSDHLSIHTKKWAISLADSGIEILIFSLSHSKDNPYEGYKNISLVRPKSKTNIVDSESLILKSVYLFSYFRLLKVIKKFNPDLLHSHYATSYGLLGALTNFQPFVLSVWGSDVFDFPSNWIKRSILEYNLRKADKILSTSHVMAQETKRYTSKEIVVTPFGVDVDTFKPMKVNSLFPEGAVVIGTIKALEDKYGVNYLIKAFKLLKEKNSDSDLRLMIVGDGSKEKALKKLVHKLNIQDFTLFTGKIPHDEVPKYLNMLDIYVAVSILESESFGVAIIEASACEIPVVVSNVGGLPEVVENQKTGIVVSPKSESETFQAMSSLLVDSTLRKEMGLSGRKRVLEKYKWNDCVDQLKEIYTQLLIAQ